MIRETLRYKWITKNLYGPGLKLSSIREAILHRSLSPSGMVRERGESFSLYNASNEPIAAFWSLIFVSAQIFCR
jgi:hypothetical protein